MPATRNMHGVNIVSWSYPFSLIGNALLLLTTTWIRTQDPYISMRLLMALEDGPCRADLNGTYFVVMRLTVLVLQAHMCSKVAKSEGARGHLTPRGTCQVRDEDKPSVPRERAYLRPLSCTQGQLSAAPFTSSGRPNLTFAEK